MSPRSPTRPRWIPNAAALLAVLALAAAVPSAAYVAAAPALAAEGPDTTPVEARILAHAPEPWYVEGLTLVGERLFVGSAWGVLGQFAPLNTLGQPSRVFVYDLGTGTLLDTILVEGEDTMRDHGLAGLKADASGRVYAASPQLGLLRWTETPAGWVQETYAVFPDLPSCAAAPAPCSPTADDRAPFPNDMTWDAHGNLYVSDSWQATVWKVPPAATLAGRAPEAWYQHASLDRAFGPNGLRIAPDGERMVLAVCCIDTYDAGPLDRASRVVTVPFPHAGVLPPDDLFVFEDYVLGEGADGIEFDADGDLWVASNMGNRIVVVGPDGGLKRSITTLAGEGAFDAPASLVFHDDAASLLVLNYAYGSVTSETRYVLELAVGTTSFPEARPTVP